MITLQACIGYITVLLFCISTRSVTVDSNSSSYRRNAAIPDDISLLLPEPLETKTSHWDETESPEAEGMMLRGNHLEELSDAEVLNGDVTDHGSHDHLSWDGQHLSSLADGLGDTGSAFLEELSNYDTSLDELEFLSDNEEELSKAAQPKSDSVYKHGINDAEERPGLPLQDGILNRDETDSPHEGISIKSMLKGGHVERFRRAPPKRKSSGLKISSAPVKKKSSVVKSYENAKHGLSVGVNNDPSKDLDMNQMIQAISIDLLIKLNEGSKTHSSHIPWNVIQRNDLVGWPVGVPVKKIMLQGRKNLQSIYASLDRILFTNKFLVDWATRLEQDTDYKTNDKNLVHRIRPLLSVKDSQLSNLKLSNNLLSETNGSDTTVKTHLLQANSARNSSLDVHEAEGMMLRGDHLEELPDAEVLNGDVTDHGSHDDLSWDGQHLSSLADGLGDTGSAFLEELSNYDPLLDELEFLSDNEEELSKAAQPKSDSVYKNGINDAEERPGPPLQDDNNDEINHIEDLHEAMPRIVEGPQYRDTKTPLRNGLTALIGRYLADKLAKRIKWSSAYLPWSEMKAEDIANWPSDVAFLPIYQMHVTDLKKVYKLVQEDLLDFSPEFLSRLQFKRRIISERSELRSVVVKYLRDKLAKKLNMLRIRLPVSEIKVGHIVNWPPDVKFIPLYKMDLKGIKRLHELAEQDLLDFSPDFLKLVKIRSQKIDYKKVIKDIETALCNKLNSATNKTFKQVPWSLLKKDDIINWPDEVPFFRPNLHTKKRLKLLHKFREVISFSKDFLETLSDASFDKAKIGREILQS